MRPRPENSSARAARAPPCSGPSSSRPPRRRRRAPGNGPMPKISSGSSTRLMPLASHSTRIAIARVAGARGRSRCCRKISTMHGAAAEHDHREAARCRRAIAPSAPISASRSPRVERAEHAHHGRHHDAEQRSPAPPPRAAPSGSFSPMRRDDDRRRADAERHRHRVDDRQHRLGEPDRRHRVRAQLRRRRRRRRRRRATPCTSPSPWGWRARRRAWPTWPCVKSRVEPRRPSRSRLHAPCRGTRACNCEFLTSMMDTDTTPRRPAPQATVWRQDRDRD